MDSEIQVQHLFCPCINDRCKFKSSSSHSFLSVHDVRLPYGLSQSVTKSKRNGSIVKCITYTSPNKDELVAMGNNLSSLRVLLEKGIEVVIVTSPMLQSNKWDQETRFQVVNLTCPPPNGILVEPELPASVVRPTGRLLSWWHNTSTMFNQEYKLARISGIIFQTYVFSLNIKYLHGLE